MKNLLFRITILMMLCATATVSAQYVETMPNGGQWYDTEGNIIDAHARSYLKVGDTYYMFGDIREGDFNNVFQGFNCYSSTDLVNWTFRNTVLTKDDLESTPVVGTRVDVLYNEQTEQFVMYFKYREPKSISGHRRTYGLATSSTVDGDYQYRGRFLPTCGDFGDGSLFQDDDGEAYLVYSCVLKPKVRELYVERLTDDYLRIDRKVWSNVIRREAPVLFKQNDRYYMITSGVTGYRSNQAQYIQATSLAGPWSEAQDLGNSDTYDSQASGILKIQGAHGTTHFYAGDRWVPGALDESTYMLLPLTFAQDGVGLVMDYYDSFYINADNGHWSPDQVTNRKGN